MNGAPSLCDFPDPYKSLFTEPFVRCQTAGLIASLLSAISGRVGFIVTIEFFCDLFLFIFRESQITPAVFPAIAPSVPCRECRTAAEPYPIVHRRGERNVSGMLKHTCTQRLVGSLALFFGTAAPISDVVIKTAVTP